MNTILKYDLDPANNLDHGDLREIEMPQGARILGVQVQENQEAFKPTMIGITGLTAPLKAYGPITETVCLWALGNTDEARMVRRMFRIYGTGKPIEEDPADLDYIGTIQTGPFVWHVFERKGGK